MYQDTSNSDLVCAVDLGGTNLRAANIDREGHIYDHVRRSTPNSDTAAKIVGVIVSPVRECKQESVRRCTRMQAVSLVVPGSVQSGTRTIVNAPNIPSLVGYNLGAALCDELNGRVLIENDANAAALGEMWQGAARGCRTIICLTLGTGVGSGIILDGELWRGVDGTAGEVGHASIEPFGGVQCKCGNIGCLEVYASATAIVRMARERLANYPKSSLHSVAAGELTSERVYQEAKQGDELSLTIWRDMGIHLGVAMASVVNIFNPEIIVIGGGVSAAFDLFAPHARAEAMKRAFPVPAQRCRIAKAECGDDAGLLGAAWLAWHDDDD